MISYLRFEISKRALLAAAILVLGYLYFAGEQGIQPVRAATTIHWKPYVISGGSAGCTVTTNAITVTLAANVSSTANTTFYESSAFTPSAAGNMLMAIAAFSPQTATAAVVTNTGTTQFSWYFAGITQTNKYALTNYNTTGTPTMRLGIWVTQLPPGVTPFSMTVGLSVVTGGTGCEMVVLNITGADTNLLWGQNAIHQVALTASNAVVFPRIDWAAPGNNGSNTIIYALADDINQITNRVPESGWTPLSTNSHNTPAIGLATFYKTYVPAATTFTTNAISSRDWAAIAVEIKAGTNACGYQDPLEIPGPNSTTVTNFFVDTASNPGGTGTASNDVSSADRAFASLKEALESTSLDGSASNKFRVIWCKGATNDTNICLQGTWDSVTTTPTTRLYIVGDNTTGTNNPNTYKIASTNNNIIYNNTPGHVWMYNIVAIGRSTTSTGNDYTLFRLATANVGAGRTDCDVRFINCGAVMTTNNTDNIFGFQDSDFAVNDVRNRCKRINCWAIGGTVGFIAADFGPFQVENYNCTSISNENCFSDAQLVVNCVGAFPTAAVDPRCFNSTGNGNGFSGWNSSTDTFADQKNSSINQTFTFSGLPGDLRTTSSDTGAGNGLNDPLSGIFRVEVDGTTRTSSSWWKGIGRN